MGKGVAAGFIVLFLWLLGAFDRRPAETPKSTAAVAATPAPVELTEEEKAKKLAQKQRTDEENAKFYADVAKVRQLKSGMKNPRSFELEEALRMDDGTLCIDYRATNSFNAIVPGQAVITSEKIFMSDNRERFAPVWNKRCAGKSGRSVRHMKIVL